MLQCGDILVLGGTNGFVGIGVGVPHTGGSNTDHESSVAIVCIFPAGSPASSSTHADVNGTVEVAERALEKKERKIDDDIANRSSELYNSTSSTAFYESGACNGDIIPVPSGPNTQTNRGRVTVDKKRKEIVIEVQNEMLKEKEKEIEIEVEVDIKKELVKDAHVGSSMAVLRTRGHGYNSNITCLATHSLELGTELYFLMLLSARNFFT